MVFCGLKVFFWIKEKARKAHLKKKKKMKTKKSESKVLEMICRWK